MFAAEYEPAAHGHRRRAARAPVSVAARLAAEEARAPVSRTLCRVADITVHGCKLQTYTALRRGSAIWLTLPGVGAVEAEVIWADDFNAGCVFHDPLRPSLVEKLAKLHR